MLGSNTSQIDTLVGLSILLARCRVSQGLCSCVVCSSGVFIASVLFSDTANQGAAHTPTTIPIIYVKSDGARDAKPVSSAHSMAHVALMTLWTLPPYRPSGCTPWSRCTRFVTCPRLYCSAIRQPQSPHNGIHWLRVNAALCSKHMVLLIRLRHMHGRGPRNIPPKM